MKTRISATPLSRWGIAAALAAAGLLSGCLGDGGDSGGDAAPPVTSQVPGSASQSSAGFIAYLQALVVSDADTLEPVDTSAVMPPADDTAEPTVIN